ncbi:ibr finger domain-containing protein [Diplodia corticola]|uniref:RBR-type E3 ubiquitin transferase n=1 Tax=Diplodia corticola TaxID=236234 RepID=A0A1J9S7X9_9PEZI|nr:ibr finger domain-containing protein [Diplodia corticola]OJD35685.1 ibr finger domain-containing protein [Diplodia corticola]
MDADDETVALILQLQSADLASLLAPAECDGNDNNDAAGDRAYAHQLYQEELEAQKIILSDRRMGKSLTRAVQTDQRTITAATEEEEAATRDHDLARSMGGLPRRPKTKAPAATIPEAPAPPAEDAFAAASSHSANDNDKDDGKAIAESSAQGAIKGKGKGQASDGDSQPTHRLCISCCTQCPFFDMATLPGCQHDYCRDCLDQLFRLSLTDESIFPPRCCRQPIPFDDVRALLSADTARDFEIKKPELETPERTYCFQPSCSTWIPPAAISEGEHVGTCPSCAARTCSVCKSKAHEGEDCPEDEATQSLLGLVEENKWQRCYKCKRFVELNTGCYHIT